MTYYDELGLGADAKPEEIHQAYRNLSRLLHPDQQSDAALQRLAEIQMKRLNAIHEVLSDPAKRRRYDLSLPVDVDGRFHPLPFVAAAPDDVAPERAGRRWKVPVLWIFTALVAMVGLFWHFRDAPATTRRQAAAADSSSDSGSPAAQRLTGMMAGASKLRGLQQQMDAMRKERDGAYEEISRLRAALPPSSPAEIELGAPPALSVAAPVLDPEESPGPARRSLAGNWLYARPKVEAAGSALYRPLFIEVFLAEERGLLRGRYRARYQVADRAISPDVNFRFEAPSGGDVVAFSWNGPGGAKGEGSLQLVGENSIEVKWTALELGAQMDLASGTALLTRRQEH